MSRPLRPSVMFTGLVRAAADRAALIASRATSADAPAAPADRSAPVA